MIKDRKSTLGYGFMSLNYEGIEGEKKVCIMGDGSVRVTTNYNPNTNLVGVQFSPAPDDRPVGFEFVKDGVPKDPDEDINFVNKTAKYAIHFDNPNSIDVVINRLQEAKKRLLNLDWKDEY